ncbi:MAG: flagellar basal-body rod modification protein FlgD [Mycobacteriales bacterium]
MTSSIGAVPPASQGFGQQPPAPASAPGAEMGKDAFLKLLVTQLKYQDPASPADGTTFIAQLAGFTQVEKLSDLADTEQKLLSTQELLGASTMIGRTVDYTIAGSGSGNGNGSGVVTSASFASTGPTVRVGDRDVPLSSITAVRVTGT